MIDDVVAGQSGMLETLNADRSELGLDGHIPVEQTFNNTDVGNAKRLVSLFGDRLRYVKEWGWLWYDGIRWKRVDEIFVHGLAKQTLLAMINESTLLLKSDDQATQRRGAELGKWAYACEFNKHTELMVDKARDEVLAYVEDFNPDPYLLNATDVTIDTRTGNPRPHSPKDMITKVAGTSYTDPVIGYRWYGFLWEVFGGNQETIDYVQKVLGYALVDVTREEHFWIAIGSGGNGKTVLFETTADAMGEYAGSGRVNMILEGRQDSRNFDLASLVGVRRVTFRETRAGQKLNEPLIKELSGGDNTMVEAKFKQPYNFKPHFKMFLYSNHAPITEEIGDSLWRRLRRINFKECFNKGKPECHEPDPDLEEILQEELPAILRWLVEGAVKWYNEGLTEPEEVIESTQEYQEEGDDLRQFLREATVRDPNPKVRTKLKDIIDHYWLWYKGERDRWDGISKEEFGRKLTAHKFKGKRSHGVQWYYGIRLLPKEEWPVDADEVEETPVTNTYVTRYNNYGRSYQEWVGPDLHPHIAALYQEQPTEPTDKPLDDDLSMYNDPD